MQPWTKKDESTLRHLWPENSAADIAKQLGRTEVAIRSRAKKLGIKKRQRRNEWTPEDKRKLAILYPDTPMPALMREFGCSRSSIYKQAVKLGVKRSKEYLLNSGRKIKPGERRGKATEFRSGHEPWNKGLHVCVGGNSIKTQFKKGRKPQTWVKIGSERITKGGFIQRKVTDTGYPPKDWQSLHRLIWQEHNGPIPKGQVITFQDGDKRNFDPGNLVCISQADNMRRNSVHKLPEALVEVVMAKARLQRQINKRMKHEKQDRRSA